MNFNNFKDFYVYYLSQHSNRHTRRWHFIGTTLALILLLITCWTRDWSLLWYVPLVGYIPSWISHWWIEKNSPASFKHPLYSLRADIKMYREMLKGKITF